MSIAALGQSGVKTYLADARGHSASEIAGADEGLRMYLTDAQRGSKVYLATSQAHGDLSDITKVQKGLQEYEK